LGGNLRLVEGLGIDEIANGLGLSEIDAAIEEGAHSELSGFGEARSSGDAKLDDVTEHDRGAVRSDLDNVVGSVGMRFGEKSNHDFVDTRFVWGGHSCPTRFDEFPENCAARL